MAQDQNIKLWHPAHFTHGRIHGSSDEPFGPDISMQHTVIILNNPLDNKNLLADVCVDGMHHVKAGYLGFTAKETHQLVALFVLMAEQTGSMICTSLGRREKHVSFPHAICGDLDSLRPDVEAHYRSQDVKIVKDPDQYSTDLTKCLKYTSDQVVETEDECKSPRRRVDVAIFGSLGGRADQAFSQLHHLYTCSRDVPSMIGDLYLITAESVMFLLEKGKNRFHAPLGPKHFTENVGIIPIGRPSIITTHGLEWDVTDWTTEFGTQMSTSNHIRAELVEVETSERVLFTLEIAKEPGD